MSDPPVIIEHMFVLSTATHPIDRPRRASGIRLSQRSPHRPAGDQSELAQKIELLTELFGLAEATTLDEWSQEVRGIAERLGQVGASGPVRDPVPEPSRPHRPPTSPSE